MRIGFVTDTYEDGLGGGVVTAVRFVEALRRSHEVTVLATGKPQPGKVVVPGFRLPLRAQRETRFTFGWPARAILEDTLASMDIVHVQLPFTLGFGAIRCARRLGLPAVAAFHVQPENVLLNLGLRSARLSRWLYRMLARHFFALADAVVCPTPFAAELLRAAGVTGPIEVVSNGASPRPQREVLRRAAGSAEPHLLLCVGRLAAEKRVDVVIESVTHSRHRDRLRLVVAGAGPLELRLRRLAQRRGVPVEFGYVSQDRLAQLHDEARVFIHASEVELEGMAVVEAMAAGLPVLIADAPASAARRLAVDERFLFRPGDPRDLAKRLDALLDSPDALAFGGRRNLEHAAALGFDDCVRRLEELYQRLVDGAGGRLRRMAR